MQFIMALFGYVKIPTAAVQLSMMQEDFISIILNAYEKRNTEDTVMKRFRIALEAQMALTSFLRTGKLISKD